MGTAGVKTVADHCKTCKDAGCAEKIGKSMEAAKDGAAVLGKGVSKTANVTIGLSAFFLVVDLGSIVNDAVTLHKAKPIEAARLLREKAEEMFPNIEAPERKHQLVKKTFLTLTFCQYCRGLLWGVSNEGLTCTDCGSNLHEKCRDKTGCTNMRNLSLMGNTTDEDEAKKWAKQEVKGQESMIGLINLTKKSITFSRRTAWGDNSVTVGPTNKIKKDWAYKYLGLFSGSGNPNVMVRWGNREQKMEGGQTLLVQSNGEPTVI